MTFENEKTLVNRLVKLLKGETTCLGSVDVVPEFFYCRGRADVVALSADRTVIAFEAKMKNWKSALHQAYRNTCFAHCSYVVLPKDTALSALRFIGEFEKRGVGLCYVDDRDLVIVHRSARNEPIEPWLARDAMVFAQGQP
jgi:hypothetical protein